MNIPQQRPNSGVLFRNSGKQDGSREPDYRGALNIAGVEYELAGWIKTGPKAKFLSLAIKAKDAAPARAPAMADDDIIPF